MDGLSRSEIEYLIREWVLKERDREILKRRWLDGICYDRLAEEVGMSDRHVKRIVRKYTEILKKHI